jgi:anti-anti-sigma factor
MDNEFRLTSWMDESGVVHLAVDGELDVATADRLVNALSLYPERLPCCVIDLTDCHFIDCAGLRALLLCQRRLVPPRRLVLVGVRPRVERALSLANMQSTFDSEPIERSVVPSTESSPTACAPTARYRIAAAAG